MTNSFSKFCLCFQLRTSQRKPGVPPTNPVGHPHSGQCLQIPQALGPNQGKLGTPPFSTMKFPHFSRKSGCSVQRWECGSDVRTQNTALGPSEQEER